MAKNAKNSIKNYLEITVKELLDDFGRGSHKPGSGSAAALLGMVSAQLIRTVIDRTVDKNIDGNWKRELIEIDLEIRDKIYPDLQNLFQEDSQKFHEHMLFRKSANKQHNPDIKRKLRVEMLESLMRPTEIPIEIGNHCSKLVRVSEKLFDEGFEAVRGDSGVALSSAISAIGGCLSIVDLNLTYFPKSKWTQNIRGESEKLRVSYRQMTAEVEIRLENLKMEADWKMDISYLKKGFWSKPKLTYFEIEKIATGVQNTLWKHRDKIWKNGDSANPIDLLKPSKALEMLGYQFSIQPTLGQHFIDGQTTEIAGIIDKRKKLVAISEKFTPNIRNFTAAHELGHAMLHDFTYLHRDRPVNGTDSPGKRNLEERQADKFAAYFLMPHKQVRNIFERLYKTIKFIIDENSVFALNQGSVSSFKRKCKDIQGLSHFLAINESFNGSPFNSISQVFGVSAEAMAIRLVELELMEF